MGFENFQPQNESTEVTKMLEWAKHSFDIWKALENSTEPYIPTDPQEAASYIEKLGYLKDHNQEKYRDNDGKDFYARVDAYIERLKEIK